MSHTKFSILNSLFFFTIVFDLLVTPVFSQNIISAPFKLVNTPYDEQSPVMTPDGRALYFTVAHHPQNTNGKKDLGDIWVSLWMNGAWTTPGNAGSELNDASYNAVGGFSADGSQLFLLGHYAKNGVATTQGIAISKKTDSGWSTPENISIPYFLNNSETLSGMLNAEGNIFIFSADSYNTKGVEDIYVSIKKDGKWNEPINLGSTINSFSQELSPSLSEDGKTIYFASNRRNGFGGFDIYQSTRLDESWTLWSTPENMQQPLNSDGRELFYRPTKRMNLFTTTRNSDGYGDIKGLIDSTQQNKTDTLIKILEVKPDKKSEKKKLVLIFGKVTNAKTGAGLSSKILFKSDSLYPTTSTPDGKFKITIPATKIYNIGVQSPNFINLFERLDIHTFELQTLEMNFKLQPIEVGAVVNLKNILFYMGTTSLVE
jgi:OOP family OmpA-OmpF porin